MNAPVVSKQLKKIDLLNLVPAVATSRQELIDLLSEYEYIPSYLDYLIDHFTAQGKFIKNDDGTIQKSVSKKAQVTAKQIFLVVETATNEGTQFELLAKANTGIVSKEDKEEGWSVTSGAAIKKATKSIFAVYKAHTDAVRALAAVEPKDVTGQSLVLGADDVGGPHLSAFN